MVISPISTVQVMPIMPTEYYYLTTYECDFGTPSSSPTVIGLAIQALEHLAGHNEVGLAALGVASVELESIEST